MNVTNFGTLEEARAYTETGKKMITPDMMVAFLTTFGHMKTIMDSDTNETAGMKAALSFGSEFNFINGHPASVAPLMDRMLSDGLISEQFKAHCIAYANPEFKPFGHYTQEMFNKEIQDHMLYGQTEATKVTYMGDNPHHVKLPDEAVRITAVLDNATTVDTTVDVSLHIRNDEENDFAKVDNWFFQLIVPAGKTSAAKEITNTNKLTRHSTFSAISNVALPFSIEVTGA